MKKTFLRQGNKLDQDKPRTDLLSASSLMAVATVLDHGAKKYAANNWRKGLAWGRIIGALLRHTLLFMQGQDLDADSGLPHVDHIACCAMFLQEHWRTHPELDDRFKTESATRPPRPKEET